MWRPLLHIAWDVSQTCSHTSLKGYLSFHDHFPLIKFSHSLFLLSSGYHKEDQPQIYVQIFNQNGASIQCPVYTAIILFTTKYCVGGNRIKFTFVKCQETRRHLPSVPQGSTKLNTVLLDTFNCNIVDEKDVSIEVKRCMFPVAVTKKDRMVHSGLCTVLRVIIQYLHDVQPDLDLEVLLVSLFCKW